MNVWLSATMYAKQMILNNSIWVDHLPDEFFFFFLCLSPPSSSSFFSPFCIHFVPFFVNMQFAYGRLYYTTGKIYSLVFPFPLSCEKKERREEEAAAAPLPSCSVYMIRLLSMSSLIALSYLIIEKKNRSDSGGCVRKWR